MMKRDVFRCILSFVFLFFVGLHGDKEGEESCSFCLNNAGKLEREWLPEAPPLFETMLANPRKLSYSAAYRFCDDAVSRSSVGVSLGEDIALCRWHDVGIFSFVGNLDFSLQAGAWVVFNFSSKEDFAEIVNADYLVGMHLTYSYEKFSHRVRFYHTSSHLGDEFLLAHPSIYRYNPSHEAIDFFSSYHLTEAIRIYGGLGYILRSDETFPLHPLYAEAGAEVKLLGKEDKKNGLFMQPFFAMHFRHWEDRSWEPDSTYLIGVEWKRLKGFSRKTRIYMEYHDGFSLEGQFSKNPTTYFSFNVGIGY